MTCVSSDDDVEERDEDEGKDDGEDETATEADVDAPEDVEGAEAAVWCRTEELSLVGLHVFFGSMTGQELLLTRRDKDTTWDHWRIWVRRV